MATATETTTYTQLLGEVKAEFYEQPHIFHVICTRYRLGAETPETLVILCNERPVRTGHYRPPLLTQAQVNAIMG